MLHKSNKYYFIFNKGSRINQIICAILINVPVFVYGAAIGWMSPMTLLLQSDKSPRDLPLTDKEVSWMAAVPYLICIPANFCIATLGDQIGRKKILFVLSISAMACWSIKIASMSIWAFIAARILVGIMMAGAYVTCPLYTNEISQDVIRGMLGSMVVLFHTLGNLFLYIIGSSLNYYTVLYICLSLPAIHILLFIMMPESPSFLVKKGKIEKAAKVLAWLRCRDENDISVIDELNQLKESQTKDDECKKFVLKAIFTDKILFRAFKIALVMTLAREVCGANPVLNFAGEIFAEASKGTRLNLTPNQQAIMLGAVQVFGSSLTFAVVEKVGRKRLLLTTSLVAGISMCTLASWFLARSLGASTPAWLPIVTLCLCIFCDSFGLQPVSVILNAELFSFKYSDTVMATTMASATFTDFLQMLFFKPIMKSVGPYAAFYFFGGICLLASVYTIVAIPETKAKSLEEIHYSLNSKKEKQNKSQINDTT